MPPFALPVAVAEAAPTSERPAVLLGRGYAAEPKLDGWRGVLAPAAGVLHTRSGRRVEHRFPELIDAGRDLGDVVLDGEILAVRAGRPEFGLLQSRRGPRAGEDVVIEFAAFDLLAAGRADWRRRPYTARRAELLRRLDGAGPGLSALPSTTGPGELAAWWDALVLPGLAEGVVLKPIASRYEAGRRSGWLKVRRTRTREFVVLGVLPAGRSGAALVLGVPGEPGRPRAAAVTLPIPPAAHRELAAVLRPVHGPAELPGVIGGLPGSEPFTYQPVEPAVVVEVETDGIVDHGRLRHRPRWVRARPDVEPGEVPPL